MNHRIAMVALLGTVVAPAASAEPAEPIAIVDPGDGVRHLRFAQHASLATPATYTMSADGGAYSEASLFIAEVDPALIAPRQVGVPVLYVGATPARVLHRSPAGCVVGLVPGHVDWTTTALFFGSTELPERVDAARGALEREAARAAGIMPRSPDTVLDPMRVDDQDALFAAALALTARCDQVSSQ
ncbi:MAG: hypothetical protein ACI8PZ_002533 [Myxococcota bacterium]|jgi:hypothetical protein